MTQDITERQKEIINYVEDNNPKKEDLERKYNNSDIRKLLKNQILVYKIGYKLKVNKANLNN